MLLLVKTRGEMREPAIGERGAQLFVTVCTAAGRIGQLLAQSTNIQIRFLRQEQALRVARAQHLAVSERPDPGKRAKERALARAGGAGYQHAFARFDFHAERGEQRLAVGKIDVNVARLVGVAVVRRSLETCLDLSLALGLENGIA